MKLTYAQLIKMMGVINEMIQVKPGPLVSVTSVLGMNANKIENALKGHTIALNAIRGDLQEKMECVYIKVAECDRKGPIVALLSALKDDPDQWDAFVDGDEKIVSRTLWSQRGSLRFAEEELEEIWTAGVPSFLGPYEIDSVRHIAVHLLRRQEQEELSTARVGDEKSKKDLFDERTEELNETELDIKIGRIKISNLARSEEKRPGYKTDATWFYLAPEMFAFPEEETDEP